MLPQSKLNQIPRPSFRNPELELLLFCRQTLSFAKIQYLTRRSQ
jgi:hypothetical protein